MAGRFKTPWFGATMGPVMATRNERAIALLIDLDGVIYQGEGRVPGAVDALAWLESNQAPHLFLTNTTSRPRSAIVAKLAAMGIDVDAAQILTPPVAARRWLREHVDGPVALFVPAATASEFDGLPIAGADASGPVGAVVIGDYGDAWSFDELNRAFRLLMTEPRPKLVALGMTRYWAAPDGLRLDAGAFVTALAHASGIEPIVLGKPAAPFFEMALSTLQVAAAEAVMVGDDVRGDIDGAQRAGIRGVLVRTGKFRTGDLELGIEPHAVLASIADLPAWLGSA